MKIFKYNIQVTDGVQTVAIPSRGKILHLGVQNDQICVWVLVNQRAPLEDFKFQVFGTGHTISEEMRTYVGTVHIGPFVWHVFQA
jgi:hypothetical protein